MTNLSDITIILDNSQLEEDDNTRTRAQDVEKDSKNSPGFFFNIC